MRRCTRAAGVIGLLAALLLTGCSADEPSRPPDRHQERERDAFHDELGLLTPTRVDPVNGYRLYAPEQLDQARLVAWLPGLGMSPRPHPARPRAGGRSGVPGDPRVLDPGRSRHRRTAGPRLPLLAYGVGAGDPVRGAVSRARAKAGERRRVRCRCSPTRSQTHWRRVQWASVTRRSPGPKFHPLQTCSPARPRGAPGSEQADACSHDCGERGLTRYGEHHRGQGDQNQ